MRAITRRSMIRDVASRWRSQYGTSNDRLASGQSAKEIATRLDALDPETATEADVVAIVGNQSWTTPPYCNECNAADLEVVVEVGQEPDYESSTAWLCVPCLQRAAALAAPQEGEGRAFDRILEAHATGQASGFDDGWRAACDYWAKECANTARQAARKPARDEAAGWSEAIRSRRDMPERPRSLSPAAAPSAPTPQEKP